MKLFPGLLVLLFPLLLHGQPSEHYYPNGNLQWRGSYKSYRVKASFGYDIKKVKNGAWEYFYSNGSRAMTAQYKAHRKQATPRGEWLYYSSAGDLLKKEGYRLGNLHSEEFYDTGLFNYMTDSFRLVQLRTDTLLYTYYMHGQPFSDIVVNNGKGAYTYPRRNKDNSLAYEVPALADDGFRLKDTAQNLIGNYSFELSKNDGYLGNEILMVADTFMHHWYSASGTPDYYLDMPDAARTGERFCGIRIYSHSEYLEYIENQMKAPLQAGHQYCCRVFFRLNPASGLATDAIGFKFTDSLTKFFFWIDNLPVPDIINKPGQLLAEKSRWMQLTGAYTAKGGERYFTIGGFRALGAQNSRLLSKDRKEEAYYVVDDVYVWEISNQNQCPVNAYTVPDSLKNIPQPLKPVDTVTYRPGKTFVIKNIFFDTDKAELLPKSFPALDSLVQILIAYPAMEIEISGHTDNTGTEERNRVLSLERAQAVTNYLLQAGIAENRLTYAGYAADEPIDTNDTPEGRQNNRRVQFKVLK